MFQPNRVPQVVDQLSTAPISNAMQSNQLLGDQPLNNVQTQGGIPGLPNMLNNTAIQSSNPDIMNMVKALKGMS